MQNPLYPTEWSVTMTSCEYDWDNAQRHALSSALDIALVKWKEFR